LETTELPVFTVFTVVLEKS